MTNKKRFILSILAIVLLAAMAGGLSLIHTRSKGVAAQRTALLPQSPQAEAFLTPARADASGVDPASTFRLTLPAVVAADKVREAIKTQPALDLQVLKDGADGRAFTLAPAHPLAVHQVYRFTLAPVAGVSRAYQWAFQTQEAVRVLGSLPRDKSAGVPVTTGIELTFSDESYADIGPFFSITPRVDGRFERHKKTVAFIASAPLQPGTLYTVTLRKGLSRQSGDAKLADDFTFAFETAPAEADKAARSYFYVPGEVQEFPTNTAPYLAVYTGKENPTIDTVIYRYPDSAAYIQGLQKADSAPRWAQMTQARVHEETAGLTRVSSFSQQAQSYPNAGNYLVFPAALPAGYYLADLKAGEAVRQVRFQVTDLSSYAAITSTRTLVWLNDLSTKAPLAGATVQLVGSATRATTDADGVATLPTPAASTNAQSPAWMHLRVQAPAGQGAPAREAVISLLPPERYHGDRDADQATRYWKYLYLDRELYRPDDQLNLWGVLQPREPGAAAAQAVTAQVWRSEYSNEGYQSLPLVSTTLPVANGIFTGSLALPGLRPGYYELQVRMGDTYLTSHWFEVETYAKPAYRLDVQRDKRAVFAGTPVTFTVQAKFFEGTPVAGLRLGYDFNDGTGAQHDTITTDANGMAHLTLTPHARPDTQWYMNASLDLHAQAPEAGEITGHADVTAFPRTVTLRADAHVQAGQAGQAIVEGRVNQVTLEPLNNGTSWDSTGPAVANQTVTGRISELRYVAEEDGEYYDFVEKTVHKRYRYHTESRDVGSFTAKTDAQGQFHYAFPMATDKSYAINLTVHDRDGKLVTEEVRVDGQRYGPGDLNYYRYYYLSTAEENKSAWALGEPGQLIFEENQSPVPDRAHGFLFLTSRLGLQSYRVQDTGRYDFVLGPSDPPNTNVAGVYFDGRQYRETGERTIRLDPKERELQVSVTPDQESYRPGDEVKLSVQVKDRAGQPVRATVNLNLVDEALFALQDQQVDLMGSLYGDHVPSGILLARHSHNLPQPGNGAEKGGEGGGVRKDFQDAIFFSTVKTDEAGRATASFRVPDNLTTWRITYHALVPPTMAGASGSVGLPVQLPFFMDMVLGDTYLTGDQPVLAVRSFGSALQTGQAVDLNLRVQAVGGLDRVTATRGTAFTASAFALPALQAGSYQVEIKGQGPGGLTDALQHSFTVQDSFLQQDRSDFYQLTAGLQVHGGEKGMTTLVFTDRARGGYLRLLESLRWPWSKRFEAQLGRVVADGLVDQYFPTLKPGNPPTLDTQRYQTADGGVAILPYSDSDLYTSALVADLAADRFDRTSLGLYFEHVLDSPQRTQSDAALALYGLAALDRPVLTEVGLMLQTPGLAEPDRLVLALAAARLGDLEGARAVYHAVLTAHGEKLGSAARIADGRDGDEIAHATALTAMLGAKLGEPETPGFVEYLVQNPPRESPITLEEALIAAAALPQLKPVLASFSYTLDGSPYTAELRPGKLVEVSVPSENLPNVRFTSVQGDVGLTVHYQAPLAHADLKQAEGYMVTRSYRVGGKETTHLQAGDVVEVELRYSLPATAPGGGYQITDTLPAGLRLVTKPWAYGVKYSPDKYPGWPLAVDGQRVTFWAGKNDKPITYYARVVTVGTYTAEEPILQHQGSGLLYAHGERLQVEIR